MSTGVIGTLDDILRSLPDGSPQASRLRMVIVALTDSFPRWLENEKEAQSLKAALTAADLNLKRVESELTDERLKREQIERQLRDALQQLASLRDRLGLG